MKKIFGVVIACALLISVSARADLLGALQGLNNALAGANNAMHGGAPSGGPAVSNGYASSLLSMGDDDKAVIKKKIEAAVKMRANQGRLAKNIEEAADQIQSVIEIAATATGDMCRTEQRFARPGSFNCQFVTSGDMSSVFWYMQNTPRTQPLQVVTISNWALQTANAFQFSVNYCSNISEVCQPVTFGFNNMGDGWMLGVMAPR